MYFHQENEIFVGRLTIFHLFFFLQTPLMSSLDKTDTHVCFYILLLWYAVLVEIYEEIGFTEIYIAGKMGTSQTLQNMKGSQERPKVLIPHLRTTA